MTCKRCFLKKKKKWYISVEYYNIIYLQMMFKHIISWNKFCKSYNENISVISSCIYYLYPWVSNISNLLMFTCCVIQYGAIIHLLVIGQYIYIYIKHCGCGPWHSFFEFSHFVGLIVGPLYAVFWKWGK